MPGTPDRSIAHDEALVSLDTVATAWRNLLTLWEQDRPNSAEARLAGIAANHHREVAAIQATLAVAEELAEIRRLLISGSVVL